VTDDAPPERPSDDEPAPVPERAQRPALPEGGGLPTDPSAWRPTRWSREAVSLLPDLGRLLRTLVADPRVPRRAKFVAGAAIAYVASPIDLMPDFVPSAGGLDDLLVVLAAVRFLVATAGYDLVRELWTGNDAGFSLVIVLAGVDH
jgi:uncharacterized membrane protein YkvA (DUF1232 family)